MGRHFKILTIFAMAILILMVSKFTIEYQENEKIKRDDFSRRSEIIK